jgi:acetolactate synthase I/II/III large subunit
MGAGVPESIGACVAGGSRRTICMVGDGSMQFNIQELQTIVHHKMPIKIMLINNDGYLAIRNTQDEFFQGRYFGTDAAGGLSLPDFQKVAAAYGMKTVRINNNEEIAEKLQWTLDEPGPVVCEVMVHRKQELVPRMGFKKNPDGTGVGGALEDMYPYLDRREFRQLMIVKPLE